MIEIPVVLAVLYLCLVMFLVAAVAGIWARVRFLERFIEDYQEPPRNKLTGKPVRPDEPAVFETPRQH